MIPRERGCTLVVGGLGGLGTVTASVLAASGHDVVVADRRADDATAWLEANEATRSAIRFEAVDVADERSFEALSTRLRSADARVAYVVAMQAAMVPALPWDLGVRQWQLVTRVNLEGCFLLARAFARPMVESGFGRIINFSSIYAYEAPADQIAYAASKGGVTALTRALAAAVGPHGVTANAICPGVIWHEGLRAVLNDADRAAAAVRTPAGRSGEPAEVAHMVRYLCSDEAWYVNGQAIHVNGGQYRPG